MMSSSCPGQLPRNERQAKYSKLVSKCTDYNPADELYSVMFQAKQEDTTCAFIRDIKYCVHTGAGTVLSTVRHGPVRL